MDNFKFINCYHFFDDQVIERGALMVGFADLTLKFISLGNHGFSIITGMAFEITRSKSNCIYELNFKPAWQLLTETLGVPETITAAELNFVSVLARELPEELHKEYGSKYLLAGVGSKNEDNSVNIGYSWGKGIKLWLTKRDEKKMLEGVDWMVKQIIEKLHGKKPLAVFHADCALRGKLSLNRILKDDLIHRLQYPLSGDDDIPWLGLYSAGEFAILGGQSWFHQASSSLFVIYR